ncbi:MAG: hypothetical protein QOC70_841 [Verrucomicrobiota bacterium]
MDGTIWYGALYPARPAFEFLHASEMLPFREQLNRVTPQLWSGLSSWGLTFFGKRCSPSQNSF